MSDQEVESETIAAAGRPEDERVLAEVGSRETAGDAGAVGGEVLAEPLAVVGGAEGDPSFARIELTCYASTFADEAGVRAAWARTVARSPLAATLRKATQLELRLAIV